MNERIQELAEQSLPAFYLTNCPSALEKFAKLIVQECAIVCETVGDVADAVGSGDQARYSRETAHGCAGMIKDMFGVE
jgi:hypothetical protein